jgi:tetratricopeptide (TPR) repeat protein
VIHSNHGNYDEAVASYFRVVNIAPTYPGIYRSLGLAYERKGEHDKAIEYFKKSV